MKRLIVCCDGTWERIYRGALTNVALAARSIAPRDARGQPQIVYYSAGVGASLGGLSIWDGMTGADLDQHLLDAYLFLNFNYEPGDQIYLFGFSRGAYTVRSLAGLLRKCGVLRREQVNQAGAALQLYRDRRIGVDSSAAAHFRYANAIAWPRVDKTAMQLGAPTAELRIRYLGVWDTVGALGIPHVLPFAVGLNRRYQFHDTSLSRAVEFARHAVAIDEKRAAFAPTLWGNLHKLNTPGAPPRVLQNWFPGDHGGVGGGGNAQGLSNCALLWVIEGAEQAGLSLLREPGGVISGCLADIDPIDAPLEAAKGFSVTTLMGSRWRMGLHRFEDVHETARLRWMANASYRPAPLCKFAHDIDKAVRSERAA
ncbi:MAG: DUF2235 domain-containing protein [Proteobacteria bacterium]|nr:DUF2235 domain-containing protein [Pseudomonadota bacterium]